MWRLNYKCSCNPSMCVLYRIWRMVSRAHSQSESHPQGQRVEHELVVFGVEISARVGHGEEANAVQVKGIGRQASSSAKVAVMGFVKE